MKVLGGFLVVVALFLYVGDVSISISPFSIKLPSWRLSVGFLLIMFGINYIIYHHRMEAKREGRREGLEKQVDSIIDAREVNNRRADNIATYITSLNEEIENCKPKQN